MQPKNASGNIFRSMPDVYKASQTVNYFPITETPIRRKPQARKTQSDSLFRSNLKEINPMGKSFLVSKIRYVKCINFTIYETLLILDWNDTI